MKLFDLKMYCFLISRGLSWIITINTKYALYIFLSETPIICAFWVWIAFNHFSLTTPSHTYTLFPLSHFVGLHYSFLQYFMLIFYLKLLLCDLIIYSLLLRRFGVFSILFFLNMISPVFSPLLGY